ncbi:LacI family DNA-binding transcriptional regulator [Pelagibacterium lacus]|uniref:LacI family transcriptional regulator n=1 Tax=Pelagibacterium lacus TaxID=2282655 RepID=A0A369W2X1_9HYPH|nr:LacI family DNA-binding transcriptional regulator [Pelagibacterium lacus]RDE08888.1 LacI family transcriptional regulator [Pelagibacterium lacus]
MSKRKSGATIADVARLAGVSTATAGRVLGDYGYSSGEKREKVLAAAKSLGYRPNLLARSLITGRTRTIGVVAGDIQSPFYASILRGISDVAERHGIGLIITNSDENLDHEVRSVQLLLEKQVDGMILSPCRPDGGEHLNSALALGIPIVQIDRQVTDLEADFVGVDNRAGAREAIARLLHLGHRRIGMIGELEHPEWTIADFVAQTAAGHMASEALFPSWQRLHGYIEAHMEAGLAVDPLLVRQAGSYSAEAAERQIQILLSAERPTAIFTADGLMTAGTMAALGAARISIPAELSIICFDDLDWMGFTQPGIDAVVQPRGAMGEAAAQLLLDRIGGKSEPARRIILGTRIISRGSVVALG